jgi:spore maturation protein CgeB
MRQFVATGAGAVLLPDSKHCLHRLFVPDREDAVWRTIDDCLAGIERALRSDTERAEIARAGHARTLAQHTDRHRTRQILGFAEQIRAQP